VPVIGYRELARAYWRSRKFDGHYFYLARRVNSKARAEEIKAYYKARGFYVRITRSGSLYLVWVNI